MGKLKKDKKTIILLLIVIILIFVCLFCYKKLPKKTESKTNNIVQIEEETKNPNINYDFDWNFYHNKNEDFVGYLEFESGLISIPFVQGQTNDTYIRTNWETMNYDEEGSVFLDANNSLSDQNLVIYGHYIYPEYDSSRLHKFTPLEKLLKEENYEANKTVYLYLENEIRTYEVVAVYLCPINKDETTDENLQYYWTKFDSDYFNTTYKQAVLNAEEYDTGVYFGYEDKFLTLQTCVENHSELREIVLLKEISVEKY